MVKAVKPVPTCDFLADFLAREKVSVVFGMIGGMVAFLTDALHRRGRVLFVTMHHEQAAAFAAEAYGRIKGVPGVAMATSGPGATNLVTGIGSCFFDASPAVFITGQISTGDLASRRKVRQKGFQETDIVAIAGPVAKAAWRAVTPAQVARRLNDAFRLAVEPRQGPVLLDIPIDVQKTAYVFSSDKRCQAKGRVSSVGRGFTRRLYAALKESSRPLVLVGGGASGARCRDVLSAWLAAVRIPVVTSLLGMDALAYDDPCRAGFIGSYGNRFANIILKESDLLIVLGSRLDVRQTGTETRAFAEGKKIFHIDCDPEELNNRIPGCDVLCADLKEWLMAALGAYPGRRYAAGPSWTARIAALKAMLPDTGELTCDKGCINPNQFMHELSRASGAAMGYAVDVGQHQMWAAQSLELRKGQRFITSGGMGAMGFALPAGVGMSCAQKNRPVVVIAGDGGFQMNIQELETVKRHRVPLKMVVMNNRSLGMVRQFQDEFFGCRHAGTIGGYTCPDFVKVARAYGIPSRRVRADSRVSAALDWLWQDPAAPALLEVEIPLTANVHPKVQFCRPIHEMEPYRRVPLADGLKERKAGA